MNNPAEPARLTLFYREGCHLCEDMEQQLGELLEPDSFRLHKVDIDESPELFEAYNVRVPVLNCGNIEVCEHFLDLQALRNALAEVHASYTSAISAFSGAHH